MHKNIFEMVLNEATVPKNMGNIAKHKSAIKKKLNGDDATTTAAPTPKNIGNIRKNKAAIQNKLNGSSSEPVEAAPAPTPKNIGNIRKNKQALKDRLKKSEPDTTGQEAPAKPYDDIEVPEDEQTDADITGQDETDEVDAEIEKQEEKEEAVEASNKARLLAIDRTKINKSLKEICVQPSKEIPINKIKELLAGYDIKLVDDNGRDAAVKLVGVDGNTDIELGYTNNKRITNSALVVYWHQMDRSEMFEFHAYLS